MADNKNYHCSQCGKETEIINYCTCYICGTVKTDICSKCKKYKISLVTTTRHLISKKIVNSEDLKCFKCGKKEGKILKVRSSSYPYPYYCEECLLGNKTENCICDFGVKSQEKCPRCANKLDFKSLCDDCFKTFQQEATKTRGVMDFMQDNWLWIAGGLLAIGLVSFIFLWKKIKERKK